MTDKQSQKYQVGKSVLEVLDDNNGLWIGIVKFVAKRDELATSLGTIETLDEEQGSVISGVTDDKKKAKKTMAESAVEVAKLLSAYARDIGNQELLAKVSFELTDFSSVKDSDSIDRARAVLKLGDKHKVAAANYGLTAAMLTQLTTDIGGFDKLIVAPKTAIANRKNLTEQLDKAVDDMFYEILVELDEMMAQFKKSAIDFYATYFASRKIDETGNRTVALFVTVGQDGVDIRLEGVSVEVISPSGVILTKQTTVRGIAQFMSSELEAGVYTVKLSKAGYQTVTISNVAVKAEGVAMKRLEVGMKGV